MYRRLVLSCCLFATVLLSVSQIASAQTSPAFSLSVVPTDTGRGFRLNWTAPEGVVVGYYLVYRATGTNPEVKPDSAAFTLLDTVKTNFDRIYRNFPPVLQSGGYFYVVRARTVAGSLLSSNLVFAALLPEFHLNAYLADSGRVKLSWNTPVNNISHYLLFRAPITSGGGVPDSNQFVQVDSLGANRNEYRDTSSVVRNPGTYAYLLRAVTITGQRLHSNFAYVYIPPLTPPETFRLTAVLDTSGGKKVVFLNWVAPTNVTVQKYSIYRAPFGEVGVPIEPSNWILLKDSTNHLEYKDSLASNASGGFAYYVRAKIGTTQFINSNVAGVYIGTPTIQYIKLSATLESGKPKLTWVGPEGTTFNMFYIYRSPINELTVIQPFTLIDSTTSTQYTDTTAPSTNRGYSYHVKGKTASRFVESNVVIVILVEKLILTGYTDFESGAIRLHWTKPVNESALYYRIYRYPVTDSLGRTPDTTKWVFVDSVLENEYKDRPTAPTLQTGQVLRGFAYFVRAVLSGDRFLYTNVVLVPWHPPIVEPFVLKGHVESNGRVELEWNEPSGFTPAKYYLYRKTLLRNTTALDTSNFVLIDSTTSYEILDSPPVISSNSFAYYVEARGSSGQKARTNYVLLFIANTTQDRVVIVSEPTRHSRVGSVYTYQPKAVSTDSTAQFKWLLLVKPTGMTVDSISGLIQWTPTVKGWFKVALGVISSSGGKAVQEYEVAVAGGAGFVEGVVTDTLGTPLLAVVKLYKRDINSWFEYKTVTDSSGSYHFEFVDVGTYIAYAAALEGDYIPQWYYDKRSPEQATPIVVADSATVIVNFRLKSRLGTIPTWNLSGRVTDTLNANIAGAVVIFARAEFILNSAKHQGVSDQQSENMREIFSHLARLGAFKLDGNYQLVYRTVTDTGGRYNLVMPQGPYIGIAFAQGYRKIFYNQKTDLLSADLMRLTKDTTNINFALIPVPDVALGSISGTVYDTTTGGPVPARIVAFRDKPDRKRPDSYYAETDTNGAYSLTELPPGEYYVLAVPLGHFVPSFYSLTGPTLRWKQATKVSVNGNTVSGIDIYVRPIPRFAGGYTYIQGTVNTNAALGGGRFGKSVVAGVNGTLVFAEANDGSVAGYGVSDATGAYTISGVAPQTYTVYTDRMGFDESTGMTSSPSYDANGNPQPSTADFNINETTTGVEEVGGEVPSDYRLEQNYPNPFNPTTRIAFSIPKPERVVIMVFNILGQRIATLVDRDFDAGSYSVIWAAKNEAGVPLATGVYLYQIITSNFISTRKMILLK